MPLQFNQIPGNIRVPFIRIEVNAGVAPYQSIARLLIFATKSTTGLATANMPIWVTGGEDALFGLGSVAAAMYKTARLNGPLQEIWVVPLAEPGGAAAAVGSIAYQTGKFPLTASSSTVVYIGGIRVVVNHTTTQTANQAATALAAAINACAGIGMQVTAAVDGTTLSKVNITAVNKGSLGNSIRVETRLAPDDSLIADSITTIVQPTGGNGDPDVTLGLANLGTSLYDFICCPWTDTASLDAVEQFLADRWGPFSQRYGLNISAKVGTAGTIQAFTVARNSQFSHIMPFNNSPMPIYLVAAATACQAAVHLQAPPELSRPLQDIELLGIRPPKNSADEWSPLQRQSFYYAGASGYFVSNGRVYIDRLVSTYQRDSYGNNDASWLDINQLAQLMYGLRAIRAYVSALYPRAALVSENPNNLQGFATPQDIKDAIVHAYKNLEAIGVFQDSSIFEDLLIVERNPTDPNRLDTFMPTEGVNGLRILAINATSYLQYPKI